MTHDEPDGTADEQASFEVLAEYLDGLQRGAPAQRDVALSQQPELASAFDCLDALDRFARSSAPEVALPDVALADARTLAFDGNASTESGCTLTPPLRFGDYELLGELGRGGMGVVFKARQKSLGRTVALKMILASQLASADQVRRFAAEAKAAAGLRHSHIVRLLDSGEVGGQPYLAMDYIEGDNLSALTARGPLDPQTAARLVVSLAQAVDYLHRQGVIHRDLKPSNVLLDADGQPYVTDFGLAKLRDANEGLTGTGVVAGTPSYMAPEQAAGKGGVTPLADVYSLGAVLYELLTGRPPFVGESPIDVLIQVLEREPTQPRQLNPSVPRSLATVCLRCLEKAPGNRYASAAALADDLERYLKGDLVEARAAGVWQRLRRWARREPALASRLGAFVPFYAVEAVNYWGLHLMDREFHYRATAILLVWVAASFVCQRWMRRPDWQGVVPFAWGAFDVLSLSLLLFIGDGPVSPLLIGFPLLVVGAGLWFRVRLVWFMTALTVLAYVSLVVHYHLSRPALKQDMPLNHDDYIYFVAGLIVMGTAVAYQVQRVRALSRYYDGIKK
ncbi:MAG TPA: serine/threonine-protein kinase [Pirellulales bacterium]|nr:serine/threonine-protein kinase [Pirellulales bacterium]